MGIIKNFFPYMKVLKNKFVNIDKKDEAAVLQTLWAKQLSGTADIVEVYERDLAKYFGTKYAIACSNGTFAIHLALLGLGIKEGDEIIVPPTAPVMTVLPVILAKAKPIFVDTLNDENFGFDLQDLEKKITKKTKAIITVPMWGYPMDMSQLLKIAKKHAIPVIEDCSQAHATKQDEKYLGAYGDIGLWSTHDRKLIATGEGAFITTNKKELYEKMQEIKAFGRVLRKDKELKKYAGQFGVLFGLNYKINALGAALGTSQLKKLKEKVKIRTRNAAKIRKGIQKLSWIREINIRQHGVPNYYAMVLKVDKNFRSGNEVSKLLLEKGIVSDTYEYGYRPLYEMPLFTEYATPCPNAKALTEMIITLPTHEGLSQNDVNHMIESIKSIKSKTS